MTRWLLSAGLLVPGSSLLLAVTEVTRFHAGRKALAEATRAAGPALAEAAHA